MLRRTSDGAWYVIKESKTPEGGIAAPALKCMGGELQGQGPIAFVVANAGAGRPAAQLEREGGRTRRYGHEGERQHPGGDAVATGAVAQADAWRDALLCPDAFRARLEIDEAVSRALAEDLGRAGDVTSIATIPAQARGAGVVVARKAGVIAGLPLADDPRIYPDDENDTISINYTSGTTGNPKGVVYHHRGAYLNAIGTQYHGSEHLFACCNSSRGDHGNANRIFHKRNKHHRCCFFTAIVATGFKSFCNHGIASRFFCFAREFAAAYHMHYFDAMLF